MSFIRILSFVFLAMFGRIELHAQSCSDLGQNPETAFPVCGTSVFIQNSVTICNNGSLANNCSAASVLEGKNPYWYKFTCFTAGSLGFVITPNNLSDDYDWQLWDVTGRNPADVYTDATLIVACNWSGDVGVTGASASGSNLINCEGGGVPMFSRMPNLTAGHDYLLLVSHFTDSQSGYSLSFGGGTASITDPQLPSLSNAYTNCTGTEITLVLNKKMNCSSLTSAGTEFIIQPSGSQVTGATGNGCGAGFDTDSITLTLNNPLPPGNYDLVIQNGNDGNTLTDLCDRNISVGDQLPITINTAFPTPMDSISSPGCAPEKLTLHFSQPIQCSSIAANGSDFLISGTYPVTITSASGACINGICQQITLFLSSPLQRGGLFQLQLQNGSDGNTLLNDCLVASAAGQSITFSISDTVNAAFNYSISTTCTADTIRYIHDGDNGVNSWNWNFGNAGIGSNAQETITYTSFGNQEITLIVSNGSCTDTASVSFVLNHDINASFSLQPALCPGETLNISNNSTGNIVSWLWDFGNGQTSYLPNPTSLVYPIPSTPTDIQIGLIIENETGCKDTLIQSVVLLNNCLIAIPGAFTPNNDGINDFLYPMNAIRLNKISFSVYNRYGQRVFFSTRPGDKWNGFFKGRPASAGTYVWLFSYTDPDNGNSVQKKGTSILIR